MMFPEAVTQPQTQLSQNGGEGDHSYMKRRVTRGWSGDMTVIRDMSRFQQSREDTD